MLGTAGMRIVNQAEIVISTIGGMPEEPSRPRLFARVGATLSSAVPPPMMLLLSILSMQLGAAVATKLFATLGAGGTVFFRLAFSAVFLAIAARPRLRTIRLPQWRAIGMLGFAVALMNVPFYLAIARIPLGVASAIQFIGPLLVGMATSRRPRDFLWLAMAAGGVAILSGDIGRSLDSSGVAWALLAAAGWAAFILASKWAGRVAGGKDAFALSLAASAIFACPFYFTDPAYGHATWIAIAGAAVVAILSTALPLSLEFAALKRLPARSYSVLVTLEPVTAAMVGMILLGQPLDIRIAGAILLICLASLGVTLFDRPR
jgi:inner membrane transporter RhtA